MNHRQLCHVINVCMALLWIYQGLIPKIMVVHPDEITLWLAWGFIPQQAEWLVRSSGLLEVIFGLSFLCHFGRYLHYLNILGLLGLLLLVCIWMPYMLIAAFNPVVMNFAMISLSVCYCLIEQPHAV